MIASFASLSCLRSHFVISLISRDADVIRIAVKRTLVNSNRLRFQSALAKVITMTDGRSVDVIFGNFS